MGKPMFNCNAKNRLKIKFIHYLNDKSKIYKKFIKLALTVKGTDFRLENFYEMMYTLIVK